MFSKWKFKSTKERGDFLLQCNLVKDKKKRKKMTITNYVEKIKYTKMG